MMCENESLERVSAKSLCLPGICLLTMVNWNEHSVCARHLH